MQSSLSLLRPVMLVDDLLMRLSRISFLTKGKVGVARSKSGLARGEMDRILVISRLCPACLAYGRLRREEVVGIV